MLPPPPSGGGLPDPFFIGGSAYDSFVLMVGSDLTKLTRMFSLEPLDSSVPDGWFSVGGIEVFTPSEISGWDDVYYEYDNHFYKLPNNMSNYSPEIGTEVFGQASEPASDSPGGTVASGTIVHLSTTEDGGIYYRVDNGSLTQYDAQNPPEITESCTLKAYALATGKAPSEALTLEFTVE